MVQAILAVISDVQILPAVIVVVARAHSLSPARSRHTGLHGHVTEGAVMIVAIQMIRRRLSRGKTFQSGAVHHENVGPAIIVIIENRDTGTSCLDDVLLRVQPAENIGHREAGLLGDIGEVSKRGRIFGRCRFCCLRGRQHTHQHNGRPNRPGELCAKTTT